MKDEVKHIILRWHRKWLLNKLMLLISICLLVAMFLFLINKFFELNNAVLLFFLFLTTVAVAYNLKPWPLRINRTRRYLEQKYDWLEHSLDLFWQDPASHLEILQRQKITGRIIQRRSEWKIPGHWSVILICFTVAVALAVFVKNYEFPTRNYKQEISALNEQLLLEEGIKDTVNKVPQIRNFKANVSPPRYTGMSSFSPDQLNFTAPENSRITWEIEFDDTVDHVHLQLNQNNMLSLRSSDNGFAGSLVVKSSFIYQLLFNARGETYTFPFYSVEVIEDRKPETGIEGIPQLLLVTTPDTTVNIKTIAIDDYGITSVDLITTVSSGDGEAVKFREKKQELFSGKAVKTWKGDYDINLASLGMVYGDELYFFIEAADNHFPGSQKTKSTTYIIQVPDTAEAELTISGGMAADVMPEYFRSQRQVIIDSEKLLKERPKISRAEINKRSNDLAHDQKSLRLRYGQFIGLEDDSGIATEAGEGTDEPGVEAYTHDHDHEEAHEPEQPEKEEEDPLKSYLHAHDSEEEVTFLYRSVKDKLRAALAVMWDAELHLRLHDPKTSLPYQYQSLKLIKEVQNHARIYVQRIGFEPPPVKESSRLSGDLKEVNDVHNIYQNAKEDPAGAFILSLDTLIITGRSGADFNKNLQQAIVYFSGLASDDPVVFVDFLEKLRQLKSDPDPVKARKVRSAFIRLNHEEQVIFSSGAAVEEAWNVRLIEELNDQ